MIVLYDSRTGNVERFVKKLDGFSCQRIEIGMVVDEPFILLTYTTGFGEVPQKVSYFLKDNHKYLRAVASSGNRNWGQNFANAANIISSKYNVPIIHKFEMSGTKEDVEIFKEGVAAIVKMDRTEQSGQDNEGWQVSV